MTRFAAVVVYALVGLLFISLNAVGQGLGIGFPECGIDCAKNAANMVGCSVVDTDCLCTSAMFKTMTLACAKSECSGNLSGRVDQALKDMCVDAPPTPPSSPSPSQSPSSSGSTTASFTRSSSSTPSSTTTSAATSQTSSRSNSGGTSRTTALTSGTGPPNPSTTNTSGSRSTSFPSSISTSTSLVVETIIVPPTGLSSEAFSKEIWSTSLLMACWMGLINFVLLY